MDVNQRYHAASISIPLSGRTGLIETSRALDISDELHSTRCCIFHKHWIFLYLIEILGKKLKVVITPASFKGTLSFPQLGNINNELHQASNFIWHIIDGLGKGYKNSGTKGSPRGSFRNIT